MSSIPLLGGLSAIAAAAALSLMATTELQFQDRALKDQAELLALAVVQDLTTTPTMGGLATQMTQQSLDESLVRSSSALGVALTDLSFVEATAADGSTVEVRLCRQAKLWSLYWLGNVQPNQAVCARARARQI